MKKKCLRTVEFIGIGLVLIMAMLLGQIATKSEAAEVKVYKWKMQSHLTPGDPRYELGHAKKLPQLVKERTDGRIEITVYPPGAICKVPDQLDALGNGVIDMMSGFGGYWQGKVPVAEVESGPSLAWGNAHDVVSCFWDRGLEDLVREAYKPFKVYYLTPLPGPSNAVLGGILSNVPLPDINSCRGVKIRAPGAWSRWFKELGFSVTFLPMGEIYTALSLKTINGAYTSWASLYGMKVHEVTKYMVDVSQNYADHLMVSAKAWNELPKDLQQTMTATAREFALWFSRNQEAEAVKAKQFLLKAGIKEFVWSPQDMKLAMEKAQLTWEEIAAKDKNCAKGIGIVKQYRAWVAAGCP